MGFRYKCRLGGKRKRSSKGMKFKRHVAFPRISRFFNAANHFTCIQPFNYFNRKNFISSKEGTNESKIFRLFVFNPTFKLLVKFSTWNERILFGIYFNNLFANDFRPSQFTLQFLDWGLLGKSKQPLTLLPSPSPPTFSFFSFLLLPLLKVSSSSRKHNLKISKLN